MDFLEHEVGVGPFVAGGHAIFNFLDADIGLLPKRGSDLEAVGMQGHNLLVLQDDHPVRVRGEGLGIAGEKVFPVANADDQRASPAGSHHQSGQVGMDHRDAQGALNLFERLAHCLDQPDLTLFPALAEAVAHQVGQNLGVRVGSKFMPGLGQPVLQLEIIFNDAVVDQGEFSGGIQVRVGIGIGWGAVGGPAGVTDA